MKNANSTIRGFDGIRALAIMAVILSHTNVLGALVDRGYLAEGIARSINGSAGVQAFFVLSGFLITHLLVHEQDRNGEVSLRSFYIRRALRIMPIYFLVVTATLVMEVMFGQVASPQSFAHAYTYTYNFVPKEEYSTNLGHTWSLAVEEHFYLVWPFIFAAAAATWRPLLLGLLVFVPVAALLHVFASQTAATDQFFVYRWSFFAGINIALGCLGALLANREVGLCWPSALTGLGGFALGVAFWFIEAFPGASQPPLTSYVRAVGFLILIVWITRNQNSAFVRLLELPPIRYVGVISYGLYMYQGFYLSTSPWRGPDQVWPPDRWLGLILLAVTAPLSYHFIERPILRLKRRWEWHGRRT